MTLDFNVSAGGDVYLNFAYEQQQHHHHQNQRNPNPNQQQQQQQLAQRHHHPYNLYQQFAYLTTGTNAASITPPHPSTMTNTQSWSVGVDMDSMSASQTATGSPVHQAQSHSPLSHSSSPHSHPSPLQQSPFPPAAPTASPLTDWALQQQQLQQHAAMMAQQQQQQRQQGHDQHQHQHQHQHQQQMSPTDMGHLIQDPLMSFNTFSNLAPGSLDYFPPTTGAQSAMQANLLDSAFTMPGLDETTHAMHWGGTGMDNWHDFQSTLQMEGLSRMGSVGSSSPTNTFVEILSLPSSSGESWTMVEWNRPSFEQFQPAQGAAIFNPSQTLHLRTNSGSSDGANSLDIGSFEDMPLFAFSPESDSNGAADNSSHRNCYTADGQHHHAHDHAHDHHALDHHALDHHAHGSVSPTTDAVAPRPIKSEPGSARHSPGSGAGSSSPPANAAPRRNSGAPRRSPISKAAPKSVVRRSSNGKKDGTVEKKVGRRKGPLLPEQRKQASEIRKLRACLRCKFLKKTCDKGEPCGGCQPSHARLWQVPCTRIDIKDIGYFMKDWKADHDKHLTPGVSISNIKGFSQKETLMWITHGYGFVLPVMVRQVYVADEECFNVDWVESYLTHQEPIDFETRTEKLSVGVDGINLAALEEYLDNHIEGPFEDFIDEHFEGTPFITEILKTAHRFYMKQRMLVIKKALKLVLAYNLTMHITMVENQGSEVEMDGHIDDEESKYYGRTVAPVMINFQIKCALADMWRELQKDILEELSSLYSGVYSGEKMKNWPTIFMLASILLAVWEEMQFDSHYRTPDPVAVDKFCNDMETTPVGVIVGLFHAISQKLPAFTDWDTRKHGHLLHDNEAVCDAMTEVRQHVLKHETYLRNRKEAAFDRYDFDSLSNKFVSKLVIRAN
ncbi:C6 finger domain protein [Geosmithia morbida]|uniref:C6 finger domain protein n=1 Tax=Geosmithia morbida TaxID=1094350 RepID=A0A9P4Z171_9HYPO|nr:C6 finger domain protein [Geosmithia morbida]KAF4125544.1 C6 finger domain protein [Geosmithia morbida]